MNDEEIRIIKEKAWNEGAVYAFSHSGEGWNSEYPININQK